MQLRNKIQQENREKGQIKKLIGFHRKIQIQAQKFLSRETQKKEQKRIKLKMQTQIRLIVRRNKEETEEIEVAGHLMKRENKQIKTRTL